MRARKQTDTDPSASPLPEVAQLVGTAIVRWRAIEIRIATPPKYSEDSAAAGLELPARLPLSVAGRTHG